MILQLNVYDITAKCVHIHTFVTKINIKQKIKIDKNTHTLSITYIINYMYNINCNGGLF